MSKKDFVETTNFHKIKFQLRGEHGMDPRLLRIIREGLAKEGVHLPDQVFIDLKEESSWDDTNHILEISWTTNQE